MASVEATRNGGVLTVRISCPPRGFLTRWVCADLAGAIASARSDADVRVIVLTGAEPDVFINHYDAGALVRTAEVLQAGRATPGDFLTSESFRAFDAVASCPKPTIAAINGICLGGGFELALCCDLRIAGQSVAQIGLPEMRMGLFPGGGATQRLPRLIGQARALSFILRGAVVDAAGALAWGLVHEVAADATARAIEIAHEFSARPAAAMRAALALVRGALDAPLAEGLAREALTFAALLREDAEALGRLREFVECGQILGAQDPT